MRLHARVVTLAASLVVLGLLAAVPLAQAGDTPAGSETGSSAESFTISAFLEVPVLGAPALSPDGSQVAYTRSQRLIDEDRRERQLWLAGTDGGDPRRLSFDEAMLWGVAWRPGGGLTYISTRGESGPQVWLNPLDGSEPRPITEIEAGVGAYWWAADGVHLAVLAEGEEREEVAPADETAGEQAESSEEQAEDEADEADDAEAEDEEESEGDWEVFDRLEHPEEYPQVWIVTPTSEGPGEDDPRQLTFPPVNVLDAAFSPDGAKLAITYNPRFSGLVDEDQRVGIIDLEADEPELIRISDPERHSSLPAFSPDGRWLAYYTDREARLRAYLNLKVLVVRDLASGTERVLDQDVTLSLGGTGSTPFVAPTWSADGEALYVPAADGTTLDLYRVDVASGAMQPLTRLEGNLDGYSIEGSTVAYLESELHRPGSLWVSTLDGTRRVDDPAHARQVDSTDDAVAAYDLQAPRKLSLPGFDGVTVEGFLFLPPEAEGSGPHPMIVEMHGGPYSRYGNSWTTRYPWLVLARSGFAVFIANPRGGTGYGEELLRGVYRNFGTDDSKDLMAAIDALVEKGIADPDRLGFTGYSYGGLMTDVMISRTDRFKAAVSIAGIFNYVSAMGQSNPQLFIDSYSQPWDGDLERMWQHSPASRANKIRTPTLVMHGTDDRPVDPRQSIELFTYLQLNNVPSRLVLYPGEGHGINTPQHMLDYQTRELEWFRHWVLGDESADGGLPPVPVEPNEGRP
jgi:dipeptidyl aminopeptidase/acylaminoacyl peptidase